MILILGAGSIGKRHLSNLAALGERAFAVADPREDRLNEAKERAQAAAGKEPLEWVPLKTQQEAFDKKLPLKAVVIATPPRHHPEAIRAALEIKCPIFCEKPVACDDEDWGALAALAEKAGRDNTFTMVAYNYRFNAQLQQVRRILREGNIGKVLSIRGTFSENLREWHPAEGLNFYMSSLRQGGGALLDESHLIDLCRWLFGDIAEVHGFNGTVSSLKEDPIFETDDLVEIVARFESGAIGSLHMDLFGKYHQKRVEAIGEEGTLIWNFDNTDIEANGIQVWKGKRTQLTPETTRRVPEEVICSDGFLRNRMYLEEARYFLDSLKAGRHLRDDVPDLQDGLKTMEVIRAVRQRCAAKETVRA